MNINEKLLESPWTLIEELADEETKEAFELDDMLVDISLKIINHRIRHGMTQNLNLKNQSQIIETRKEMQITQEEQLLRRQ